MPPAPVPGTELWPAAVPVATDHLVCHFFSFGIVVTYMYINIYTYILKNFVSLHPFIPRSLTAVSHGPET
jgi:hypothetical protein